MNDFKIPKPAFRKPLSTDELIAYADYVTESMKRDRRQRRYRIRLLIWLSILAAALALLITVMS